MLGDLQVVLGAQGEALLRVVDEQLHRLAERLRHLVGGPKPVVVVVVWEGCDAAKALPGLHHGDRAYRQVDSLYRILYNSDLPGRGQSLLINKAAQ